jgi:hypothetical protein
MSYAYAYGFDRNQFDKYATIQEDISDTYLHLVEGEQDKESEDNELDNLLDMQEILALDELSDKELLTLDWNN